MRIAKVRLKMWRWLLILGPFFVSAAMAAQYTNTPGTLALWHMDEGSGNMIYDASGNSNNGTLAGGTYIPTWNGGRYGNSGIDLNVDLPTKPTTWNSSNPATYNSGSGIDLGTAGTALFNRDNFTFQFNLNWDGNTGMYRAGDNLAGFVLYTYTGSFMVRFHQLPDGTALFRALHKFNGAWQEVVYNPGSNALQAGLWYDIAATRQKLSNGTTDIKLFINGSEAASKNITGTWTAGTGSTGFGYVRQYYGYSIGGQLDEARVLNYAIPEPVTLALLGFGGLFIRRRK